MLRPPSGFVDPHGVFLRPLPWNHHFRFLAFLGFLLPEFQIIPRRILMRLGALFSALSWTWVLSRSLLPLGSALTGSSLPLRPYRFQPALEAFLLRPVRRSYDHLSSLKVNLSSKERNAELSPHDTHSCLLSHRAPLLGFSVPSAHQVC